MRPVPPEGKLKPREERPGSRGYPLHPGSDSQTLRDREGVDVLGTPCEPHAFSPEDTEIKPGAYS